MTADVNVTEKERGMSGFNLPRGAVEAAARAIAENTDEPGWSAVVIARAALTAAGPAIAAEVRSQREAFLPSDTLDSAWIAGWNAAVDHVAAALADWLKGQG